MYCVGPMSVLKIEMEGSLSARTLWEVRVSFLRFALDVGLRVVPEV